MFFLLPLGHDSHSARRLPLVTMGIIAVSLAALLYSQLEGEQVRVRLRGPVQELFAIAAEDPQLELPPDLRSMPNLGSPPVGRERHTQLQARADELVLVIREEVKKDPAQQLGYRPATPRLATIFSYQFMHGGWLHFVGNAWLLWLCGCNLEDRWGRLPFAAFYLVCGVFAALTYGALAPDPNIVLIGASGAIAGAMGAFAARFATTEIAVFYAMWIFRFQYGVVRPPAWVALLLWFLAEVGYAVAFPDDRVAHWAHVGGFAFGLPFALGLWWSGLEQRLDAAVEEKSVVFRADGRLEEASKLMDEGRLDDAARVLSAVERERGASVDVLLVRLREATERRDPVLLGRTYQRLVQAYVAVNLFEPLPELLQEIERASVPTVFEREPWYELGEALARRHQPELAERLYGLALRDGLTDAVALRAALAAARLRVRAGRLDGVEELLDVASTHPARDGDVAQRIEALRAAYLRASFPDPVS